MNWREFLKPTKSKLIIFILIVVFSSFAIPLFGFSNTTCKYKGVDCRYSASRAPLAVCLIYGFHEEKIIDENIGPEGRYRYYLNECDKSDSLWVLIMIPLIYLISSVMGLSLGKSISDWRIGSKNKLLNFILVLLTLIPILFLYLLIGLEIVDSSGEINILEVLVSPFPNLSFILFFTIFGCLTFSLPVCRPAFIVTPLIILSAIISIKLFKYFKRIGIKHAWLYTIWIFLLSVLYIGLMAAFILGGIGTY